MPSAIRAERYRTASSEYVAGENISFYSTDDFFGYLREDDYATPSAVPGLDIAIGRSGRIPFLYATS